MSDVDYETKYLLLKIWIAIAIAMSLTGILGFVIGWAMRGVYG